MPSYNVWFGPFVLNSVSLQHKIDTDGPGVILLGTMDAKGSFYIKRVESAKNVRSELKKWIGDYEVFMFELVRNEIQAVMDQHAVSEYFGVNKTSVSDPQGKHLLDEFKEGLGPSRRLNLGQE